VGGPPLFCLKARGMGSDLLGSGAQFHSWTVKLWGLSVRLSGCDAQFHGLTVAAHFSEWKACSSRSFLFMIVRRMGLINGTGKWFGLWVV